MTATYGIGDRLRPTIRIDGKADARVSELIHQMRADESEGGLSSLEVRLKAVARFDDSAAELVFEDEKLLKLGSKIDIYTGPPNEPSEIFRGVVTGLEGIFDHDEEAELVVLAEDALQRARMARKTLVHDDAKIASLATDLAKALGLRDVVTGYTESIGLQVQWNESDLAFLRRLLAAHDGDLQVVGKELHVSPRLDVKRGTVKLKLYEELLRARVTADLAHQVTAVTTSGWDALNGTVVKGRSQGSQLGPGKGRKGSKLLQDALAERVEHLGGLPVSTDKQATAIAEAAFLQRARKLVRVEGTAQGTPALRVGAQVELSGLSKRFDNTYYVVSACHRYDLTRGYETDFQAECSFLGDP